MLLYESSLSSAVEVALLGPFFFSDVLIGRPPQVRNYPLEYDNFTTVYIFRTNA